jgi:hypothetical protein
MPGGVTDQREQVTPTKGVGYVVLTVAVLEFRHMRR